MFALKVKFVGRKRRWAWRTSGDSHLRRKLACNKALGMEKAQEYMAVIDSPFCCDILPSSPPPPPIVSRSDSTHGFCNMVINWWTVGPWWLQELHVRHQCPKAIYVLCQWGASEYHMSRRLMSSLFLLMGTAGTARLEISMPASEINSTRAS